MAPNRFMSSSMAPSLKRMRSPSGSMMIPSLSGSGLLRRVASTCCMFCEEGSGETPPKVGSGWSRNTMSLSEG